MSLTFTDLFCGAGGSSIGAELTGATLRLGLNHWERAIETHAHNFQHADHDCEDVSSLTTAQIRRYPDSDVLLASPECTNHSLAKGARRRKPQTSSLFEDGPAGDDEQDRSRATMWDVCRFAEQKLLKGKPYKAIIVENVVDAFNWGADDDGGLFDAWLKAMDSLGYEHEIVWLNSMFAGAVPQSRDRMYVVYWRKGIRAPDLCFSPPSWCPGCAAIVDGGQAFKKLRRGRPWGRYGPQYLFKCPDCGGTVFPGAHPAETIIDWGLEAPIIGDRDRPLAKNSRERIRRGLARILSEPFAIRLSHGGNPKPLTLPLVTLTGRHDMAMVTPVAGNTFERTPGNRARRTDRQPLDTVHGTLDRALVVPTSGEVAGRPADAEPAPTQVTTRRAAVVTSPGGSWSDKPQIAEEEPLATLTSRESKALTVANRANNIPKPVEEPTAPVLTGSQQAVVIRNNTARGDPGQMASPTHEPIRSLTTAGHQSVVIPYDSSGRGRDPEVEPASTLTSRDWLALVVPQTRAASARLRHVDRDVVNTLASEGPPAVLEVNDEQIDACGYRMFALHEIGGAMAMLDHPGGGEYVVLGNKRERMAQYGNAVTPPATTLLLERVMEVLA